MRINERSKKCSACKACLWACPRNAISFSKSKKGFEYPKINEDLCVNCGICSRVCQCEHCVDSVDYETYVAYYDSDEVRQTSQSGGLFYGLAECVLDMGGVVYGSAVTDDLSVACIRAEDLSGLHRIQGSKYVQSDTRNSYVNVERDLNDGKNVIYGGTSCMIDGLYRFLDMRKVNVTNLITCDLICHGVVSPELYRNNIERVSEGKKILSINFRNKKYGWHSHNETYTFADGSQKTENNWAELMYTHVALRECCYKCQYSDLKNKPADITMGDFWGLDTQATGLVDDNKGVSLAIVRSGKGENLLKKSRLTIQSVDKTNVLDNNRTGNIAKPYIYRKFWHDYYEHGYSYCLKKYTIYGGVRFKIKRKILSLLKRW